MKNVQVIPYIKTIGTEKYREFLLQPFNVEKIISLISNLKIENDNILIDVSHVLNVNTEKNYMSISFNGEVNKYPIPKTLNDFINIIDLYDIKLIWGTWVNKEFEPKDCMRVESIKEYYKELLQIMDKSHELL